MAKPRREHIGQLLVQTTRFFQAELFRRLSEAGLEDLRVPHTHVSAYIEAGGTRPGRLAEMARMTPPAMGELIDDLVELGYVERIPDPDDRRAKLVLLTDRGRDAMAVGRRIIGEIEAEWAQAVGPERFEQFASTFDDLLGHLRAPRGRDATRTAG